MRQLFPFPYMKKFDAELNYHCRECSEVAYSSTFLHEVDFKLFSQDP